ncbi:hypothetical protein T439DRAFT_375948 [Meredithblackwellia eburnea MCA 4105]
MVVIATKSRRRSRITLAITVAVLLLLVWSIRHHSATRRFTIPYDWPPPAAPNHQLEDTEYPPLISQDQLLSFRFKDSVGHTTGAAIHVVRALVQSDASTWRGTKPQLSSQFIQILAFIITPVVGARAAAWKLDLTCTFHGEDGAETPTVEAEVDWIQGGLRDGRAPDGTAYFYATCNIPSSFSSAKPKLSQLDLSLAFKLVGGSPGSAITKSDSLRLSLYRSENPPSRVATTACVSPVWYEAGLQPTRRFLEWRTHLARLGVERVAWYTREPHFEAFVSTYNSATGATDTITAGKGLISDSEYDLPWLDQDLWYQDCLLKNRHSTTFLLVIDADEFIRFGDEEEDHWDPKKASESFQKLFSDQPAMVGALTLDRVIYVPGNKERTLWPGGTNPADLIGQEALRCRQPDGGLGIFKTIYRANTVYRLNQHAHNVLYPASPADQVRDGLTVVPKRPYEGLRKPKGGPGWPELGHFKFQFWPSNDELCHKQGGEAPPLTPGKRRYLAKLKAEVEALHTLVSAANKAWMDALYSRTIFA